MTTPTTIDEPNAKCPQAPIARLARPARKQQPTRHLVRAALASLLVLCSACASVAPDQHLVTLPVLSGWFEGEEVSYITTDVSHADVALDKGANFAPRLAGALPAGRPGPGAPSTVDKVYAVTNFQQGSIFASAPSPVGPTSRDTSYSPLWQMVRVTWVAGQTPRALRSEEDVLAAADRGLIVLEPTRVVLNCPIVKRGRSGALPGVGLGPSAR